MCETIHTANTFVGKCLHGTSASGPVPALRQRHLTCCPASDSSSVGPAAAESLTAVAAPDGATGEPSRSCCSREVLRASAARMDARDAASSSLSIFSCVCACMMTAFVIICDKANTGLGRWGCAMVHLSEGEMWSTDAAATRAQRKPGTAAPQCCRTEHSFEILQCCGRSQKDNALLLAARNKVHRA